MQFEQNKILISQPTRIISELNLLKKNDNIAGLNSKKLLLMHTVSFSQVPALRVVKKIVSNLVATKNL